MRDVGYKPATPVETGIRRFVDWYLEYYRKEGPATPRVTNLG
jgi:nucleoside-diphosphate-sugar epimerase